MLNGFDSQLSEYVENAVRVKFYREKNFFDLEQEVNVFIKENNIEILDIKFYFADDRHHAIILYAIEDLDE